MNTEITYTLDGNESFVSMGDFDVGWFDGKMFIGADSTAWQELSREELARFLWAAAYFIDSGQQWVEDEYPAINYRKEDCQ